jgi:hypothetical protein
MGDQLQLGLLERPLEALGSIATDQEHPLEHEIYESR